MKVYEGANIRNVVMMGHGHAGKTSLVSAMLYTAGATQRLGRVDDGTAPTDYDDEEIARKMSIGSSLAYVEWGKTKINVVDTPGFSMFVHEAKMVLPVVEAAIVVVDGVAGVEVVTQRIWSYCEEFQTPRLIVASRMDRERADSERVMESLTRVFGRTVIPLELPIGKEKNLSGVVDLVRMKAYTYDLGGNGKGKETEIPANLKDQAQEAHEKLVEMIAEGNDTLMEEFFDKGTIPEEDLIPALHVAIREDRIFPVIFSSGLGNIGADRVMDFIVDYTPAPTGARVGAGGSDVREWRAAASQSGRYGTNFTVRVQDGLGSFCGTDFLFQSLLWRGEERCRIAELHPRVPGEVGAHFHHAGKDRGAGSRVTRGRHRSRGQAARDADGRHIGGQGSGDPLSQSEFAGAGDYVCH